MTLPTKIMATLTASALAISACTPVDQPTTSPNQRAKEAAAIGAIGGALAGAAVEQNGRPARGAIIGAAVGAAAGAAYGNMLDKQAAELRATLDGRIQITNAGDYLVVTMPQDILFDVDSTFVRSGLRSDLAALADNLQRYPNSTVEVVGHTDNTGAASYNQDLSERRAAAVRAVLLDNGVRSSRVRAFGRGEDSPIATNQTLFLDGSRPKPPRGLSDFATEWAVKLRWYAVR